MDALVVCVVVVVYTCFSVCVMRFLLLGDLLITRTKTSRTLHRCKTYPARRLVNRAGQALFVHGLCVYLMCRANGRVGVSWL